MQSWAGNGAIMSVTRVIAFDWHQIERLDPGLSGSGRG